MPVDTVLSSTNDIGIVVLDASAAADMIAMAIMPRVVSILGHNFSLGRLVSDRQRLHQRCRAVALEFKGCLETGVLTKERVEAIVAKMNSVIKAQQELDQCKRRPFNKNRRKIFKGVKNGLRDLEIYTRDASTECQMRHSIGQTDYQSESGDLELEAASRRAGLDPVAFTEQMRERLKAYLEENGLSAPTSESVTHGHAEPVTITRYCRRCHPVSATALSVPASGEACSSVGGVHAREAAQSTCLEDPSGLPSSPALDDLAETYVNAISECATLK